MLDPPPDLELLQYRLADEAKEYEYLLSPSTKSSLLKTLYEILLGSGGGQDGDTSSFLSSPSSLPSHTEDWGAYSPPSAQDKGKGKARSHSYDEEEVEREAWTLEGAQRREREVEERERGEERQRRRGMICGRSLVRGERCYNCKTCAIDSSCVLCASCFFASSHEGHDVSYGVAFSFSGYCDCGDPSAWLNPTSCSCHPPAGPDEPSASNPDALPPGVEVPPATKERVEGLLRVIVDYMIDVLRYAPVDTSETHPKNIDGLLARLATSGCSDALRDTYQNSQLMSGTEGKGKSKEERREKEKMPFGLVLWSDEKHTGREVRRQVGYASGLGEAEAGRVVDVLEKQGRIVLETSTNYYRLLHICHTLSQIDLGLTLRPGYDTYREELVSILISFLSDLCHSSLAGDDLFLRRTLCDILLEPHDESTFSEGRTSEKVDGEEFADIEDMKRLDWLFCLFTRLWKSARVDLINVFVKMLTSDMRCKLAIGDHFAKVYHRLVDQYIFTDREPELSLLLWGMQLLPVSTIAESAVANEGIVHKLLQVLTSYFTEQHDHRRIHIPPREIPRVDADVQAFRTKKWQTVSGHLKAVLHSPGVRRQIMENPVYLEDFSKFLELFMGMAPQLRATSEHVEYESDSWIRALGVSMELSRMTSLLGQGYKDADASVLLQAIQTVSLQIFYATTLIATPLDPSRYRTPEYHNVFILGKEHSVINFVVAQSWVSIHNPLHWLLAELLKHTPRILDGQALAERNVQSFGEMWQKLILPALASDEGTTGMLAILEYPLRTITYLSQVKAGMWVRNGIGMRGQLHHYREHPLRETTYDQDLLMIQLGFSSLNPTHMLASVVDRFGLVDFFKGNAWGKGVDALQQSQLVEEFLLLLINLFSETWSIMNRSREDFTRREIIHQLCLGPLAFSELVKRLSERTIDIPTFSTILDQVAKMRQPQAVAETGVYELRPECFDEVNPLFFHFTRNQQGEAYDILVTRLQKASPGSDVVLPKRVEVPERPKPFSTLLDIFFTDSIMEICYFALHNAISIRNIWPAGSTSKSAPQSDGIIDLTLHLCLLALAHAPKHSSAKALNNFTGNGRYTLAGYLCLMEADKEFKSYRPRVKAILSQMSEHQAAQIASYRSSPLYATEEPAISGEDARKAAVKKRQDAILAGFAKNQAAFLDNYDDEEDDDEAMEEDAISHGPCIVCQEECVPARPSGLLACIQPSLVMRDAADDRAWFGECMQIPTTLDKETRTIRYGFGTTGEPIATDGYPQEDHRFGYHTSACGHLMHEDCLAKFFKDTELRQNQQGQRNHPENAYRKEFVCPLCKSVGNILVPLDVKAARDCSPPVLGVNLADWIRRISDESLRNVRDAGSMWDNHSTAGEYEPWFIAPEMEESSDNQVTIWDRFQNVVGPISAQTMELHLRPDGFYLAEDLVSYTISMLEITQRGQAPTADAVDGGLSDASLRLLRGLISILRNYVNFESGPMSSPAHRRITIFARFLPEWFRNTHLTSPLLLRDPISLVVETAALSPDIIQPIITLAYYAELTRTIVAIAFWAKRCLLSSSSTQAGLSRLHEQPAADETSSDAETIFSNFRTTTMAMFRHSSQLHHEAASALSLLSDVQLSRLLYAFTLPFLRRCKIIRQVITPSSSPLSGFTEPPAALSSASEYSRLLTLLEIPPPKIALQDPTSTLTPILATWLSQWASSQPVLPRLEYPGIYELYRLPNSLEDVLRYTAGKTCKRCGKEPTYPGMCWVCGEFVCLGTDCCAEGEIGECNLHRMRCGGATGMFIDIKRWATLYLYAGSGSFGPLPFLDCHGEVDQAMRRGFPQYQYQPRADELRRIWLTHGVPSFVARRLELTLDQGGWGSL